jgi:hypothetical protein
MYRYVSTFRKNALPSNRTLSNISPLLSPIDENCRRSRQFSLVAVLDDQAWVPDKTSKPLPRDKLTSYLTGIPTADKPPLERMIRM